MFTSSEGCTWEGELRRLESHYIIDSYSDLELLSSQLAHSDTTVVYSEVDISLQVNSIRIGDTSGFPPHISGGLVTEKKAQGLT